MFGVDTLAISPDGKWALAGNPTVSGGTNAFSIVNLETFEVTFVNASLDTPVGVAFIPSVSPLASDFDGDRKADPAVCNPTTGHWKIRLSGGNYTIIDLPNFLN